MDCLNPIVAYDLGLKANGKHDIRFKVKLPTDNTILVPCGKCDVCRRKRQSSWIQRLTMELQASDCASFVTLTYNNESFRACTTTCACDGSQLQKRDIQLFVKRLRNLHRDGYLSYSPNIRYFCCGEYGKLHHRPHWHLIVFGLDFLAPEFKPEVVMIKDGYPIYTSNVLKHYWPLGYNTVDVVTPRNIRYVTKYVSKDTDGVRLSSQGLGRDWFVEHTRQGRFSFMRPKEFLHACGVNDFLVIDGKKIPLPVFVRRYLDRFYPDILAANKQRFLERKRSIKRQYYEPSAPRNVVDSIISVEKLKESRLLDEYT